MKLPIRNIILLVLMLASSGLAIAMRPVHKIAEQGPAFELEAIVPKQLGAWVEEERVSALIVDPNQAEVIKKTYSQTLSRTYVNGNGYRIMLSLAYGSDQTDRSEVHKPEVCYPAQGFVVHGKDASTVVLATRKVPVTRIQTSLGSRIEPVTYWITVGNQVVESGLGKKIAELRYGLTGKIPDGMLVRVSSIDANLQNAYLNQDAFLNDLISALDDKSRDKFIGATNRN
ncbi:MAG: EpsI family protein [Gammaproteobacteria bacterium]|nr:EpsI family protein [Gammaproteobacteria bacterium]MBU2435908.1 EpsI family protein [Gammaproteobacteria bacterium]MBU2449311.1 EpsI family protein [Gammaproteobacteria bacterium]